MKKVSFRHIIAYDQKKLSFSKVITLFFIVL